MISVDIHNVSVAYRKTPVLWSIDAEFPSGSLIGIVGPNGSGKSTLIKACTGLIPILKGEIKFFGKPLEEMRKSIAYLPQRESIDWEFPINALDVVLMGTYGNLGLFRRPGKKEISLAKQCLEKVGMLEFSKRQISELSGGQQQRVFLARALAQNAEIYFLDEPFAAVDLMTEEAIMKVIKELKETGKTIIVVHHDLHSVIENMDYVCLLNTRLIKFGKTSEVMTSENLGKAYGGQLNIFTKVVSQVSTK